MEATITLTLTGQFAGWSAEMDADPEWATLEEFASEDIPRISAELVRVVKTWNFRDRNGEELPVSVKALSKVPMRAIVQLIKLYQDSFKQLPN